MSRARAQRLPRPVPARIAPLETLPLFHRIAGRKAVVAGSSDGALWKAELLAAAGAQVLVLAGEDGDSEKFEALPSLAVERRGWTPADLLGAALAVADLGGGHEADRFVAAAREAGVPVNVIDRTELCDVQFGTIVNRSPILLAISTGGAAPMLGQSIRARVEAVLPLRLSAWAKAAKALRPRLKERVASFRDRRAFWEGFVERAWGGDLPGDDEPLFRSPREGRVTLVGAGPGDPELLTLKAVRALQSATVILYDDLVGPEILELARREAKRVAVGKTGRGPSCRQSDINARMVALARSGETVVRLKGGDPLVFGRSAEELEACRAAGIEVTIVPGISAAQGAAASLGFSLTERREARRIQFVTGHGADGRLPGDLDWRAIADPAATTIVYMPRATLGELARSAIAAGLSPDMPAVAIASATLPEQAQVAGTIATIDSLAADLPAGAPVTVVIGRVARERRLLELRAAA